MFQPWRMQLRRAAEALAAARLDEARALVRQGELPEYLPAKKLMARLASQFVRRGQQHVNLGQSLAGWRDLEAAAELGAAAEVLGPLREQLVNRAIAEAERYLAADEPAAAIARLQALQHRGPMGSRVRELIALAEKLESVGRYARQANFAQADAELAGAGQLRPDLPFLAERRDRLRKKEIAFRALRADLHDALAAQQWSDVVNLAERLLELAPGDDVAREARAKAWSAAGVVCPGDARIAAALAETQAAAASAKVVMDRAPSSQPVGIRRSGEGYLLVPRRTTRLNGREIREAAPLADGATMELGHGVKLKFRQPHPLSRTARLEFVSRHRTQPPTDGVLLMAESCILGPAPTAHVDCAAWNREVVLLRQVGELRCRTSGDFQIDGAPASGAAPIRRNSHISGEDFSVKLEEV
jgi:hypothetical protein